MDAQSILNAIITSVKEKQNAVIQLIEAVSLVFNFAY